MVWPRNLTFSSCWPEVAEYEPSKQLHSSLIIYIKVNKQRNRKKSVDPALSILNIFKYDPLYTRSWSTVVEIVYTDIYM